MQDAGCRSAQKIQLIFEMRAHVNSSTVPMISVFNRDLKIQWILEERKNSRFKVGHN